MYLSLLNDTVLWYVLASPDIHCVMLCTCLSRQTLYYVMYLPLQTYTVLWYVLASPDRHCIMLCTCLSWQTLCYVKYLPLYTDTVLWYVLASPDRHCIMLCTCLSCQTLCYVVTLSVITLVNTAVITQWGITAYCCCCYRGMSRRGGRSNTCKTNTIATTTWGYRTDGMGHFIN